MPARWDLPRGAPAWAVAAAAAAATAARDAAVAAEAGVPADAVPFKGAVLAACGLLRGGTADAAAGVPLPTMRPVLSYLGRRGRRRAFDGRPRRPSAARSAAPRRVTT